ncbi:MAG: hypothetical protein NT027_11760 [Proteobacteria bacterium]|nr:hypothetical protein [Pseudomonadota bacterium]
MRRHFLFNWLRVVIGGFDFKNVLTLILLLITMKPISAQVLPKGIGAYALGYRQFSHDAQLYNSDGKQYAAGDKFNLDFSSQGIANGKAGDDLSKLYQEIKKFEPKGTTNSVADEMNFGELKGDVKTSVDAKIIGFGYGITDRFTFFMGAPLVSASVDTKLKFEGSNNATAIKSRLGDLVFKEIQEGLDRASRLSEQNIREQIEVEKGYAPIDHWEYNGLGDTVLGLRTEFQGERMDERRYSLGLLLQADLPTGHADDPDILTDIPIGKGYTALTIGSDTKVTFTYLAMGWKSALTHGFAESVQRRVPEGTDKLVAADRKAKVQWTPGMDFNNTLYSTIGNSWLRGTYNLGLKRHYGDRYSGSLQGNYGTLSAESDSVKLFHEAAITVTSVRAFSQKSFKIPLILTLAAHDTLTGRNTSKETYFELTFSSFFSTPAAAPKSDVKTERKPEPKPGKGLLAPKTVAQSH